ncbi:hypothetical protein Adi01nite_28030 [Amorphoplanes digitatis]|nr:hypothetical protein Adi01nite_28030 [Actinoplanes digitatis]
MSEPSAAPAVSGTDSQAPSGTVSDNNDDSPSATADHEASSSPVEAPNGNDRDAGEEVVSDTASAAGGGAVPAPVTDSDATAVEPGASPAADPEFDSAAAQAAAAHAANAAAVAAHAAAEAADAAAEAADAAAEAADAAAGAAQAAAVAADAAEAAAVAANLALTATRGRPAGIGVAGKTETDDEVPVDAGAEAATGSDVPGDETLAETEPQARGIAAWGTDRRRDLLAYICVPLVTLFAVPTLVLFWGIAILGNSTGTPAICDGVRAVNGCEEATWAVIRVHVLGFLGLWALLWALPWWQGLRTPRVLFAAAAGAFLFAGLLRLAA